MSMLHRPFAEIISVGLILIVVFGISVPFYARTESEARSDLAMDRLHSVRDAINMFQSEHGRLPGEDGSQQTLKSELLPYLGEFPVCPVGEALYPDEVEVVCVEDASQFSGGLATWHGWKYNLASGKFIINYRGSPISKRHASFDRF